MPDDKLYTVTAYRSGPPDRRPAIVVAPQAEPVLVLLPSDDRSAGTRALIQAGAVMLATMGPGYRGINPNQGALVRQWAEALGCEVITLAERQ